MKRLLVIGPIGAALALTPGAEAATVAPRASKTDESKSLVVNLRKGHYALIANRPESRTGTARDPETGG